MKKKKTKKKQQKKKKTKKVSVPRAQGVTAIIPLSEIARPETYQGKYSLIPTVFNERQLRSIIAETPKEIIKQRPGRGGGKWDYVPGWWFRKKANFIFGFAHDFKILGERIDGEFITVKGEITVRDPKTGQVIAIKEDYGGAAIKFQKGKPHTPQNFLDISNDFKAASTDCFKRCMVQFGVAMDIYGKGESKDEGITIIGDDEPSGPQVPEERHVQSETGEIIKLLEWFGFKDRNKQIAAINRLTNLKLEDWRMTKTEAKEILSALLKKKLEKGK